MNAWRDLVDWVGAYPFEVAKPEEIIQFCRDHGLRLTKLRSCRGHGCNEFLFSNDCATAGSTPERLIASQ